MINFIITLLVFYNFLYSESYPLYIRDIPNGNYYSFSLGHSYYGYKPFSKLYVKESYKWSQNLCRSDSDNDGQYNGLEMGDPCCIWTFDSIPTFTLGLSDPNDKNSKTYNIIPTCL